MVLGRPSESARPRARCVAGALAACCALVLAAACAFGAGAASAEETLTLAPATVFSAAKVQCGAPGGVEGSTSTQWLLDGAPIAGADAPVYTPPRIDDGHLLSCSQTVTGEEGSQTLRSPERVIHEQPPQPSWPISPAAADCAAPVCMQEGAGPGATGEAYAQSGAWWGARQVRCVSAPWTSIVGNSSMAAVSALAEAHAVRLSLLKLRNGAPVTLATAELPSLGVAADALDGSAGPFSGAIVVPYGSQRFAAGELWSRVFPEALGRPDWFAPESGLLAYARSGAVPRSFQLTYTLGSGELGSVLGCRAEAVDGPASAPTEASFTSHSYLVPASGRCGPRRLASLKAPQPALLTAGDPRCLAAPSALPAVGRGLQGISLKGNRLALALDCELEPGCDGHVSIAAGAKLASVPVRLAHGAERVLLVSIGQRAVRLVRRAGHAGLGVTVTLVRRGEVRTLARARLIGR